jgi:very-short-patch-repair endonuclease
MLLDEKICNTCNIIKSSDNFYFRKQTGKLQGDCKVCYQDKKRKKLKENNKKRIPKKKKCIDCENLCDARKKTLRCYSCENKKRWKNADKKQKFIDSVKKKWESAEYRQKMSNCMKKQRSSPEFIKKLSEAFPVKNRLSSVHRRIRKDLSLDFYGFQSEVIVDKYFVDEIHEDKKIIIEINGDYVHANPKKYTCDEIIRLPGSRYTASEKWHQDQIKISNLEKLGYKVIVIWESDDIEIHKKEIGVLCG